MRMDTISIIALIVVAMMTAMEPPQKSIETSVNQKDSSEIQYPNTTVFETIESTDSIEVLTPKNNQNFMSETNEF